MIGKDIMKEECENEVVFSEDSFYYRNQIMFKLKVFEKFSENTNKNILRLQANKIHILWKEFVIRKTYLGNEFFS